MAKRIDQLDGIRALAITAVFFHHVLRIKLLWMGVDLFFILSGFLITGVLLDNKDHDLKGYFGHFYQRRVRRILPPYLLLLFVSSVLFGFAWVNHWYFYLFLMNILEALRIPQAQSFSILWSLAVEEQFYLVWPFVVYFLSDEAITWAAGGIILGAPILRWVCTPLFSTHWPIYVLTPFRMDLLAVGALLAIVWRKRPDRIRQFGHYGLIFSALGVCLLAALSRNPAFTTTSNSPQSNVWIYESSLLICTGIILWALSGRGVRILTLPPVRFLGRISYTVYLIHLAVYYSLTNHLHRDVALTLATSTITLLYASASWFFLEKPLLTAKPKPIPAVEKA